MKGARTLAFAAAALLLSAAPAPAATYAGAQFRYWSFRRSEEHTSELQSRRDLVCRLLPEKKKTRKSLGSANAHTPAFVALATPHTPRTPSTNRLISVLAAQAYHSCRRRHTDFVTFRKITA